MTSAHAKVRQLREKPNPEKIAELEEEVLTDLPLDLPAPVAPQILNPTVAYCVVTYQSPTLLETLQSIPAGHRLLVIDNSIHEWSLSKAWNYACQRLLQGEGYEVVVVMNDDIILQPNTGQLLADGLLRAQYVDQRPEKDRLVVLASAYNVRDVDAKIEQPGGLGMPPKPISTPWWSEPFHRNVDYRPIDVQVFKPRWGNNPDFSCWAMTLEGFKTIGNFEEQLPLYFEDNDYHRRITLSGFSALSYAPYWHHGSQTRLHDPLIAQRVAAKFEQSKGIYVAKWGGLPGAETFTKPWNR